MTELGPRLTARETGAEPRVRSWVSEIGDRWGAAALVAAAAVATFLAVGIREQATEATPDADDLALALVASEGDPAVLLERLGIPADPVLAWLTFDGVEP
jgi:hypothetical protein